MNSYDDRRLFEVQRERFHDEGLEIESGDTRDRVGRPDPPARSNRPSQTDPNQGVILNSIYIYVGSRHSSEVRRESYSPGDMIVIVELGGDWLGIQRIPHVGAEYVGTYIKRWYLADYFRKVDPRDILDHV